MAGEVLYLDSSALVKLVLPEPETPALLELLKKFRRHLSSALCTVEVNRAVRRTTEDPAVLRRAQEVIAGVHLLRLDDELLQRAAQLAPPRLRTLDSLHLASAMSLGAELAAIVAYDTRLADAAREAGLAVLAPES